MGDGRGRNKRKSILKSSVSSSASPQSSDQGRCLVTKGKDDVPVQGHTKRQCCSSATGDFTGTSEMVRVSPAAGLLPLLRERHLPYPVAVCRLRRKTALTTSILHMLELKPGQTFPGHPDLRNSSTARGGFSFPQLSWVFHLPPFLSTSFPHCSLHLVHNTFLMALLPPFPPPSHRCSHPVWTVLLPWLIGTPLCCSMAVGRLRRQEAETPPAASASHRERHLDGCLQLFAVTLQLTADRQD